MNHYTFLLLTITIVKKLLDDCNVACFNIINQIRDYFYTFLDIIYRWNYKRKDINIYKVPSHISMKGNETADISTMETSTIPGSHTNNIMSCESKDKPFILTYTVLFSHFISFLHNKLLLKCLLEYTNKKLKYNSIFKKNF